MAVHVVDAQDVGVGGGTPGSLTPPPQRPPSVEGYEVRQLLGETPASDIYLAAHTASGVLRTLAVQRAESDPAVVRRIVREVLEASRVKHPNVALVDGVGTTRDGRLYVATAYVAGTTLAELLEAEGHLPARRAVQIALRAADALDAAHKLAVMHGDLTPEHIIVGPPGPDGLEPVAVTGFGMGASRTASATPVAPSKQARPYASPERMSGAAPDARSDVFSLASVLMHALSGNAPPPPRASAGRGTTPTFSPAVQPNVRPAPAHVLLVARAAEPERRHPNAAAFREALAAAFGGAGNDDGRRTPDASQLILAVETPRATPAIVAAASVDARAAEAPSAQLPPEVSPAAARRSMHVPTQDVPVIAPQETQSEALPAAGVPASDPDVMAPTSVLAPTPIGTAAISEPLPELPIASPAAPAISFEQVFDVAPLAAPPTPRATPRLTPPLRAPRVLTPVVSRTVARRAATPRAVTPPAVPVTPDSVSQAEQPASAFGVYQPPAHNPPADNPLADEPLADQALADQALADQALAHPAIALEPVALEPVAAAPITPASATAPPATTPLSATHRPRSRRPLLIGGVVVASVVVGLVAVRSGGSSSPAPAASAATRSAGTVPTGVTGLAAAVTHVGNPPVGAPAGDATLAAEAVGRQPEAVDRARPADKTEEASPAKREIDDTPAMPKVVLPDVAMRPEDGAGDSRLSQGALSEVASANVEDLGATGRASEGLAVDAGTRAQINAAMGRFARALESRDINTLRQAYPGLTAAERETWTGFFRSAESVRARFTAQDFQPSDGGIDVNAVGKLTFYKRDSRQQVENAVTFRVLMRQTGGAWVMKKVH